MLKQFKDYLTEKADEKSKITVLICTKQGEDEDHVTGTSKRIIEECKREGLNHYVIFTDDCFFNDDIKQLTIHNYKDNKFKLKIDAKNTVAIIRGSVATTEKGLSFIQSLQSAGCFVINSRNSFELCSNKYWTTQTLSENGINCPRSALLSNVENFDACHKLIGGQYPIVIKTLRGAEGIGVSIAESQASAVSFLQTLFKQGIEILIQEYLPIKFDVRIIIMDGQIIGVMRRNKIKKDFRSNASLGATTQTYELNDEEKRIALKAAKLSKAFYCGVDLFNVDGKIYVVEINTSPGSKGVEETTKKNIIGELIKYIADKTHWKQSYLEAGYVEKCKVFFNGEMIKECDAKLDSGNGLIPTLHADNIITDKGTKTVSFEIDGKKYSSKYYKVSSIIKTGSEDTEMRVSIIVDLHIGTNIVKKCEVYLGDRTGKIKELEPLLLGRDAVMRFNFLINPGVKYIITGEE